MAGPAVDLDSSLSVFERRVYDAWKKPELVALCRERGLPTSGNRVVLTERLRESDAELQEEAILKQYEDSLRDPKLACKARAVTLLHRTKLRQWHAECKGNELTITTGKIGEKQRRTCTKFEDPMEAHKGFRERIRKKLKEGFYRTSPWPPSPEKEESRSSSPSSSSSSSSPASSPSDQRPDGGDENSEVSTPTSPTRPRPVPSTPGSANRKRKKGVSFSSQPPEKRTFVPFEVLVLSKKLTVAQLKEALKLHGLDTKGKKRELFERLKAHVEGNPNCQATEEDLDFIQLLEQQP